MGSPETSDGTHLPEKPEAAPSPVQGVSAEVQARLDRIRQQEDELAKIDDCRDRPFAGGGRWTRQPKRRGRN